MEATLLGGLLGGIFRIAPEIMKVWDRKNERTHELAMQDKAIEFQRLKGDQRIDEIKTEADREWDTGAINALMAAIKGKDEQLQLSGHAIIDFFIALANIASKLMRPAITFQWVICLYPAVIIAGFVLAVQSGIAPLEALIKCFGDSEKGLVAGIINFWFLSRVFDAVRR